MFNMCGWGNEYANRKCRHVNHSKQLCALRCDFTYTTSGREHKRPIYAAASVHPMPTTAITGTTSGCCRNIPTKVPFPEKMLGPVMMSEVDSSVWKMRTMLAAAVKLFDLMARDIVVLVELNFLRATRVSTCDIINPKPWLLLARYSTVYLEGNFGGTALWSQPTVHGHTRCALQELAREALSFWLAVWPHFLYNQVFGSFNVTLYLNILLWNLVFCFHWLQFWFFYVIFN